MSFNDLFKPYSPEIRGNLEEYLKAHNGRDADNLFYGAEYFFIMKDKGFLIPYSTCIRIDLSPAPDQSCFVNSDFLLESRGHGKLNMSMIGAKKGIYNPDEILKNQKWSILGLKI